MKKILISAYTCCPDRGSEPGNGWNWIMNYENNNYSPVVLTSGIFKIEIENYLSLNKCKSSFIFFDSWFDSKLLKIPFFGVYLHFYIWLYSSRKYIKKIKPDEWCSFDFAHHITYSSIKLGTPLYNIPIPILIGPIGGAIPVHPSLRKYLGVYFFSEWIKEKFSFFLSILNPTVKKSIKSSKHILYSNYYVKEFIEKHNPHSCSKIYDAGLSDYFKMEAPPRTVQNKEINIIWVGRMLPRKGLNLAIEAFYRLTKSSFDKNKFTLFIAGDGKMKDNAAGLVKKYNLQNEVIFLGNIPHTILTDHYKKSHIFLFPSLKDSCPMQIFEAMATGLPVVTLDHQGMTEQVISNTGIKVKVGKGVDYPGELSNAILQIISNETIFQTYSKNAFTHGQNQIWSKRIAEFVNTKLPGLISKTESISELPDTSGKKILLIHSYYQQSGGEEVVFHQEKDYLAKSEIVKTLTFQNKPGFRGAVQFLLSLWNIFGARKIKKMINKFQPDVIHLHNWHYGIGPIVIRVAKKKKIPIVLTLHNYRLICPSAVLLNKGQIFMDSMKASFPWKAVFQRVYRISMLQTFWLAFIIWFHKKIGTWKMVDKFIVLADFEKNLFVNSTLSVAADKIIVKPNFAHKPETIQRKQGNHFLFIGRLSNEKGVNVLLDVFKETNYELHIGGKGPLKELVEKTAREHTNIKYLGYLDKKQVQQEMHDCTALVFPSIWYEGLPMTLLEAFAIGKAIIATKLGVMEIVIQHRYNGLKFEPGNTSDLKAQLDYWQNLSVSEKEAYKQNVLSVYDSKYTPEQAMKQLMNIYKIISEK